MNVERSSLSSVDSLPLSRSTTSESGSSEGSTNSLSKNAGRKISISRNRDSASVRRRSNESYRISPNQEEHTISLPSNSSKSSSKRKVEKPKINASPVAILQEPSEALPATYFPVSCAAEELDHISFQDYQNFSSSTQLENDHLILFEEETITAWPSTSLLPLSDPASPEEKNTALENNKIIAGNNKVIKAHFGEQIREHFGDRIADYFLLSTAHQAYLNSSAPLTVGVIRIVLQKAEEAKTFVQHYTQAHPEVPGKAAEVMGHAAFLEKESAAAYKELEKLGLPEKILEEISLHNVEFLKAAGVQATFVGIGSAATLAGFVTAVHLAPTGYITSIVSAIGLGFTVATRSLNSSDSTSTTALTRMLAIATVPLTQVYLANAIIHHASLIFPGALFIGAGALNYARPARYIALNLENYTDYNTPLSEAAKGAEKLVRSRAILEETITIQRTATTTYQEAAQLVDKQSAASDQNPEQIAVSNTSSTTANISSNVRDSIQQSITESRQRLVELDKKRLKELPYSSFVTSKGRFRVQF